METSPEKLWTLTGRQEALGDQEPGQGWTKLCSSGGSSRDKSKLITGIMMSSAKRWCNKYFSFSSDGEVFHLRLYPEGELLTDVAQRCQVLFGSVDIDYLSCSKLPLQIWKNAFLFMASRGFLSCSGWESPTTTQMQSFGYEGKLSALLGRYLVRLGVTVLSIGILLLPE